MICLSFIVCRNKLGDFLLAKPRMSSIVADKTDKQKRLILLKDTVLDKQLSGMPKDLSEWILSQPDVEVVDYETKLSYDYFTAGEGELYQRAARV